MAALWNFNLHFLWAALLLKGCGSAMYEGPKSDHFDGEKFANIDPWDPKGFWTVMRWQWSREKSDWPDWVNNAPQAAPPTRVEGQKLQITFVNHATTLIQTGGLNILTDPIWSERASPVSWAGPKRVRAPGLRIDQVPPIDVILVSHNHYDHLDLETLKVFSNRDNPVILTGLGNDQILNQHKLSQTRTLDWWQSTEVKTSSDKTVKFTFVPAQHFSARGIFDQMRTLWGGFVIENGNDAIYFAGDTAWGSFAEQIHSRFPAGFRASLIPIGAYEPRWFMKGSHLNPEESVRLHLLLKSRWSMGIHFGTFKNLADEKWMAAENEVYSELQKNGIGTDTFVVPNFGRTYTVP